MIVSKKLSKLKEIKHGFFNNKGGCSTGIYKSLNCGPGSNDYKTKVFKNLRIVIGRIAIKNIINIFVLLFVLKALLNFLYLKPFFLNLH